MAGNTREPAGDGGRRLTHRLYAEFEITLARSLSCPLGSFETEVTDVRHQRVDGECHIDATVIDDGSEGVPTIVHAKSAADPNCHCDVFLEHDCLPRTTSINGRTVIIETYLPERERLTDLVDDLKTVTAELSLRRLIRIDTSDSSGRKTVTLDLHRVTEKQREAALKAVAAGYYELPRETTVGELAADLGISKSAMSQRLTAVESKLAIAAFKTAP